MRKVIIRYRGPVGANDGEKGVEIHGAGKARIAILRAREGMSVVELGGLGKSAQALIDKRAADIAMVIPHGCEFELWEEA